MLIEAYKKNKLRIILDEDDEIIVFAPLFTHLRNHKYNLHKGMINKYTYECDPHIFNIFFRERPFKDMNNLILVNKIFRKSTKIDLDSIESTYNYSKLVAEFTGVLNDVIRIEVSAELRDDYTQPIEDQKNKVRSFVSKMYSFLKSRFVRR